MDVSFERKAAGSKDEWLTPPEIIKALGVFDLDPCAPLKRPWDTAKRHYTKRDDGLKMPWRGRVWCNPPYGRSTSEWLKKCANHGDCIALTFARTETNMFFEHVWNTADAVLFIKGRLKFYHKNGKIAQSAGAPSVLIAYGKNNVNKLHKAKIEGVFITLK